MRKSTTVHFLSRIDLFLHSVPPLSPCSEKHTEERQHPPKSSRLWQMDRLDAWILHRLWPLCCQGFCVVLFHNSTTTRRLHRNFYFSIFNHQLCLFVFFLFLYLRSWPDVEQLIARVETRWRTCAAWSQVMPNSIRSSGVTRLRSSAHSADRTRLPIRGVTGNVARPFPGSTPARNHGGLSSDTRPAPTSREPRVQVKLKLPQALWNWIYCSRDFHSFIHETKDLSSRPSRRPKKVESFPVMKLSFRTMTTRTGLACVFQLLIGTGRNQEKKTNKFVLNRWPLALYVWGVLSGIWKFHVCVIMTKVDMCVSLGISRLWCHRCWRWYGWAGRPCCIDIFKYLKCNDRKLLLLLLLLCA
jgi:hypothetical protein